MRFLLRVATLHMHLVCSSCHQIRAATQQFSNHMGEPLDLPSVSTNLAWTRNTMPGEGHRANPGPWRDFEGSDRTEWCAFFGVHPGNPKFMIMQTDMGRSFFANSQRGNGTRFDPIDIPAAHGSTAAFHPSQPGTAFVLNRAKSQANVSGWYRTTDEGESWAQITTLPDPNDHIAPSGLRRLLVADPRPGYTSMLYMVHGTLPGIQVSLDGGDSFEPMCTGCSLAEEQIWDLSIAVDRASAHSTGQATLMVIVANNSGTRPVRGGGAVYAVPLPSPSDGNGVARKPSPHVVLDAMVNDLSADPYSITDGFLVLNGTVCTYRLNDGRGELAESQVYGSNSGGRSWVALSGGKHTGALPQFFGANGQPQVGADGSLRFCDYSGLYSLSGAAIDDILGKET